MKRLDLEDLPPKIAALLAELEEGEELIVVQHGAVVARLSRGSEAAFRPPSPEPEVVPEERAKEVFELFRASVEDEF
jgi:antitoxin (DNA-binding transcriptional repressor) of toxin-antitoxin stability system